MSTIETKNLNVGNCQVIPLSVGPPVSLPTEAQLVSGTRALDGTLRASKIDGGTAAGTFLVDGTTDYGTEANRITNQSVIIRLQDTALLPTVYATDRPRIIGCCELKQTT